MPNATRAEQQRLIDAARQAAHAELQAAADRAASAARAARSGTSPATATSTSPPASPPVRSATRTSAWPPPIAEQALQAHPRLEPLLQRAADPRWPRRSPIARRHGPCASSSATRAPRPTRRALKLARRYQTIVKGRAERIEVLVVRRQLPRPHGRHGRAHRPGEVSQRLRAADRAGRASCRIGDSTTATPRARRHHRQTCAVIVEPIQAEGGIIVAAAGLPRRRCADCATTPARC